MKKVLAVLACLILIGLVVGTAGCISQDDFDISILDLETDDGIYWTAYVMVTNLSSLAIDTDLKYTFTDNHGNLIGEVTKHLGKIAAGGYKTDNATIKANRYVDYAYVNVLCTATR